MDKFMRVVVVALIAVLFSSSSTFAVDVATEAELRAALDNVAGDPNINITAPITLTADLTLPDAVYTINGAGNNLTTINSLTIPSNVTVDNLLIDGVETYIKNTDVADGGAIANAIARTINNGAVFTNNSSTGGFGGAIDNSAPFTINGNTTFTNNSAANAGGAIANWNTFIINDDSSFTDNTAVSNGGAISNSSNFTFNGFTSFLNSESTTGHGGAIYNTGTITINNGGSFTDSSANNQGGAFYNNGTVIINNGVSFTNSQTGVDGGAISNNDTFTINNGAIFTNNYAGDDGGAIYNTDMLTINGGAVFTDNSTNDIGGAIYNHPLGTLIINDGATFSNNFAITSAGGAIRNSGVLTINGDSVFSNNDSLVQSGGAIYNDEILTLDGNAVFIGNSAFNNGGAIFNSDTLTITNGAVFQNNTANGLGGAICNNSGTITLIANTNNVEFTGNTANGVDNAIVLSSTYGAPGILNLNASSTNSVIFNDGISSEDDDNVININATNAEDANIPIGTPNSGVVYLNADMSNYGNIVGTTGNSLNLYGGTLALGSQGVFFDTADFTAAAGTTLDLINNKIDSITFGTADINGMNLKVDADLAAGKADTLNATGVITNGDITVTKINVIREGTGSSSTIIIDPDNEFNITLTSGIASGQVYNYNISESNGKLSFIRSSINPVVQASAISQQSAYLAIANINNIAFDRADNVLSLMDNIKFLTGVDYDNVNKVAILEGQPEYSKLYGRLEEGAVWFRPFNSLENITIDGVEGHIDSTSYGMLLGFDSPLKRFKRGVKGMLTVYGGYGGASQAYKTIDLHQNGGLVGVMGTLYKGNFYTSLTTSIGGYGVVEKIKSYGSSDYGMLTTNVASKTGYNFHLPGRTVLQLNGQAAYSFVSAKDYDNAQGTRIDTAPLHVLQVVPGVKVSKHIGSWQPYLSTSVVFNALNDSAVRANDIVLPDTQIGDYIEYGAGVEKHTESGASGFLQAMVRNGARSGINFKFGLKFPVGKKSEKI